MINGTCHCPRCIFETDSQEARYTPFHQFFREGRPQHEFTVCTSCRECSRFPDRKPDHGETSETSARCRCPSHYDNRNLLDVARSILLDNEDV